MRSLRVMFLLASLLSLLAGCKKAESGDTKESQAAALVPVEIASVKEESVNLTISAVGQVEPLRKEVVLSPVSGAIVSFKVLEGTAVRSGDLLAVIQTRESQAAVTGAQGLLNAAKTPEQKKDAERALALAKSSQNMVSLESKSSGIVSARNVVEGSLVAEGTELMTIIDPESMVFVALVPLKDLPLVKLGGSGSVALTQAEGVIYDATVASVSPQSDPQTQTVRVRLKLSNVLPEQRIFLKEGIPGTAHIVAGVRANALMVPAKALLRNDENDSYTIVTVTDDSLSRSVPVVVGVRRDSLVEISGPAIHAGMPVIVSGNYALADSTRVTITARKDQ